MAGQSLPDGRRAKRPAHGTQSRPQAGLGLDLKVPKRPHT